MSAPIRSARGNDPRAGWDGRTVARPPRWRSRPGRCRFRRHSPNTRVSCRNMPTLRRVKDGYLVAVTQEQYGGTPTAAAVPCPPPQPETREESSATISTTTTTQSLGQTDQRLKAFVAKEKDAWIKRYNELLAYKAAHNNCNVPSRWKHNPQLGQWVKNQRERYRLFEKGKQTCMTKDRIIMLQYIGFQWSLRPDLSRDGRTARWAQRFAELKQYKQIHKHCNVPSRWKDNPRLGSWVATQRREYRYLKEGKPSTMTDERIRALESIRFGWSRHVPVPCKK